MVTWMAGSEFLALRKSCGVSFEQLADWTGITYSVAREWGHSRPAPLYAINLLVLYNAATPQTRERLRTIK